MKSLVLILICFSGAISAQNNFNYLDINNVKAGISNQDNMHFDFSTGSAAYEVPVGSGHHSDFITALWIRRL